MNQIYNTFRPSGYRTINAYIFSENPVALIDFLKNAFYAEEQNRSIHPETGDIVNCEMKIGDSNFMISQARGEFLGMRASFYLFVNDVDTLYQRALDQGAQMVFEPMDMSYEDRQGGVVDPSGNYWWISKRLVEKDYEV